MFQLISQALVRLRIAGAGRAVDDLGSGVRVLGLVLRFLLGFVLGREVHVGGAAAADVEAGVVGRGARSFLRHDLAVRAHWSRGDGGIGYVGCTYLCVSKEGCD